MRIVKLTEETRKDLLSKLLKRSPNQYAQYEGTVAQIVDDIREKGDEALFAYTEKFDHIRLDPESVKVTEAEIEEAYRSVDPALLDVIRKALVNIRTYHEKQRRYSWFDSQENGILLGQKITPLQRVGVYVPGGKAVYPSSVLMNVVPAKVAGVPQIIMTTPCRDGNIYVALAKKAVYGFVGIDSIAGPSEITVLADETANPRYVAADLLSQAEHDELASSILVTTSESLAQAVSQEVDGFLQVLSRKEIISKSLENYGYILLVDSLEEGIMTVDQIAPEHLEIVTANPFDTMTRVHNAGAMFLGSCSSEPLGDYFAGPNHILPTNGTARFFSPLGVDDFVKKSSIVYYSEEALRPVHTDIETFAKAEELTAHANSVAVRFE